MDKKIINKNPDLFDNSLLSITLYDALKRFFAINKVDFYLFNELSCKSLYNKIIYYLAKSDTSTNNETILNISKILKIFNLGDTLEFRNYIIENKDKFDKNKFNLKCLKDLDKYNIKKNKLTKRQISGQEYINKNGKGKKIDCLLSQISQNKKINRGVNLIIVRSQYGNGPVLCYKIKGRVSDDTKQINSIKNAYHYETNINYMEARPIYYEHWLNLPEDKKYATANIE